MIAVGDSDPIEDSYCHYVANGSLPEFLPDPSQHPVSMRFPVTAQLPVGTHLSVPIRFTDGRVYGTFCAFSRTVKTDIDPSDLKVLRVLAEMVAEYLEFRESVRRDADRCRRRIQALLDDRSSLRIVFQPLVVLATGRLHAVEALARFSDGRPPDVVFAEAWAAGLGVELELTAVRAALAHLDQIPSPIRLGINISPATLASAEFHSAIGGLPKGRVAFEITEHDAVASYAALGGARARLSTCGIRLTIDDVGMGFSGLNHVIELTPDTIKLDRAVVKDVDSNPLKAALVEAFVAFGTRADILLIAEGIETAAELDTLRAMGVPVGQGYHLGCPGDLARALG